MQITHKKQTKNKGNIFNRIVQYHEKSTAGQYNSWHPRAGTEWTGRKSYWLRRGEEVGDDRTEGSSAMGGGGRAAVSLLPDTTGCANAHSHLCKFATLRCICRGLIVSVKQAFNSAKVIHKETWTQISGPDQPIASWIPPRDVPEEWLSMLAT